MKLLKGLGITLALLIGVYLILALFGPSSMHVERSIIIKANAATVYNEINTLKQWQMWSYWDNIDPNMKSTYEGPESGVGAKHMWTSENDSVGNGTLTIRKSEPTTLVECDLEFEGMGVCTSGWRIKDTVGGVMVTAYMDGETPFLMRPMMLFMDMDAMLGADFEKTLKGLKDHCEGMPSPEATVEYVMEMTMTPAWKVMTVTDSSSLADLGNKLGSLYGDISAEMQKQGLNQAGAPFAIYDQVVYNADGSMNFWLRAGIPTDKAGKNAGRVMYWESTAGNAVKCNYYGDYMNTGDCHEAIDKWIKDNGKTVNGPVWEVYVTDPGTEPDTSKWLTEIYYPVQ